jgi:hypothetical protein
MCSVVKRGLKILHSAWEAEQHDKQRAARLYQQPDWDSIRERLLEGLRAVHLVCSAGLVKAPDDFSIGVATLQAACDVLPVRIAFSSLRACILVAWQSAGQRRSDDTNLRKGSESGRIALCAYVVRSGGTLLARPHMTASIIFSPSAVADCHRRGCSICCT